MTYLEGVYWDLDGTIANTELEAHLPAFNNAFNDLGINWNWDANKYINLLKINGAPLLDPNIILLLRRVLLVCIWFWLLWN